jgi:hypothetical protein
VNVVSTPGTLSLPDICTATAIGNLFSPRGAPFTFSTIPPVRPFLQADRNAREGKHSVAAAFHSVEGAVGCPKQLLD